MSSIGSNDGVELELRTYLDILRRRWRVIAVTTMVFVALAVLLSVQQEPLYAASADVLIDQQGAESLINSDPNAGFIAAANADRELNNEVRALNSGATQAAVAKNYAGPLDPDMVTAAITAALSDVVTVSVTATDPDEAALLVNTYANTYIDLRRQQRIDELVSASTEVQQQVDDLAARIALVRQPITDIENQLVNDPGNADLESRRSDLVVQLAPEINPLEAQRAVYQGLLEDLRVSAGIVGSGGAKVLTEAEVPTEPVAPQPARSGVLAGVVGLIFGVGLAFVRDSLDEQIRDFTDIERAVPGYAALAAIPEAASLAEKGIFDTEANSPAAEAFRSLRTAVRFVELDRPMQVIQVTSSSPSDGKSTVAANLAVMLGQAGFSVSIVCCDLRRPSIHTSFDMSVSPGLADVVLGDRTLAESIRTYNERTFVLPAGSRPPNPSELLGSDRTERVVRSLAEKTDYVIVDTPPVLPVTDPVVVSRFVDATIVVAASGSTTRRQLQQTLSGLAQAKAPVIGIVLNRAGSGDVNGYGYTYGGYEVPGSATRRLFGRRNPAPAPQEDEWPASVGER